MLESINTLEKARRVNFKRTAEETVRTPGTIDVAALNIGQYDFAREDTEASVNFKEVLTYIMGEMAPIRIVPWKKIKPLMDSGELMSFGQLHHNAFLYHRYLHEGWLSLIHI